MDYRFKTKPFQHQLDALKESWNKEVWALFMEMGTGKTKVCIDNIAILFDKNTLELKGWEIKDQYNNKINFSLKIVSKNNIYQKETFQLPRIN